MFFIYRFGCLVAQNVASPALLFWLDEVSRRFGSAGVEVVHVNGAGA